MEASGHLQLRHKFCNAANVNAELWTNPTRTT